MKLSLSSLALGAAILLTGGNAHAQIAFGSSCAGASGATPTLAVSGAVRAGETWTLEITASGGIGLGYLLIGFTNTSATALGGIPLPIDLGTLFNRPQWGGCPLTVDPSYAIQPYAFNPSVNGGVAQFTFPGWDVGTVYMQAVNIDADFVTRIAGVSRGVEVRTAPAGMVAIKPGRFLMGSDAASGAPYFDGQDENLTHTVTISYPFWIGQYEVTQADYQSVLGSNPSTFLGPNRPVESVSWMDARAYCATLTATETLAGRVPHGFEYRIPTEAEWEYACRAGSTTEFNVGDELHCADAWFGWTFHPTLTLTWCGNSNVTADVGGYAPNAWGLFDMHGNVWEWCLDSFENYNAAPVTDPFATGGPNRVIRGGSWNSDSNACRSAIRASNPPGDAFLIFGFRVVLAPILVP
jgi:formylglycine-generating enzyme required for sulfatase activity